MNKSNITITLGCIRFFSISMMTTAALCVAGTFPACNKYLYGLQVVVPGLAVCVCEFKLL